MEETGTGFSILSPDSPPPPAVMDATHTDSADDTISTDNAPPVDNAESTDDATSSDNADNATPTATSNEATAQLAPFVAQQGIRFVAGRLEFSLTALPLELLYTLRMFAATNRGDLSELKEIVESSVNSDLVVPYVIVSQPEISSTNRFSTISVTSNQGVDVNAQYQPPAFSDDVFFSQNFNRRRSSLHMAARTATLLSPASPVSMGVGQSGVGVCGYSPDEHKLLLHIAIEKGYLDIVMYLLSQNADVSCWSNEELTLHNPPSTIYT